MNLLKALIVLWYITYTINPAKAQNLSNGTNATCTSKPGQYSTCCFRIQKEAKFTCKEFDFYGSDGGDQTGLTSAQCDDWVAAALHECEHMCGDCEAISKVLFQRCYFFLQGLGNVDLREVGRVCTAYEMDFKHRRCASACGQLTSGETVEEGVKNENAFCRSPEWAACNERCGNYMNCRCGVMRGKFGEPDHCQGYTILKGIMPGSSLSWDCRLMPTHAADCTNHRVDQKGEDFSCGKYRYCPADLCVVKNVSCPLTKFCWAAGKCNPRLGTCSYAFKQDDTPCDDNLHYTYNDRCQNGDCKGDIDMCVKENIKCTSVNPCLLQPGQCHPTSGACTFEAVPDGTDCIDDRPYLSQGVCQGGLCRNPRSNLCHGDSHAHDVPHDLCEAKSQCHVKGRCDEATGVCSNPEMMEGIPCDDGDPGTRGDLCIEGNCIGEEFADAKFELIGEGACLGDSNERLSRYIADMREFDECKQQCVGDPACIAFSYGYYTCSIYGFRERAPDSRYWGRRFIFEPGARGDVVNAKVMHSQDAKIECWRKGVKGTKLGNDKNMVRDVIVMLCLLLIPFGILYGHRCWDWFYMHLPEHWRYSLETRLEHIRQLLHKWTTSIQVVPEPPGEEPPQQQDIAPPDSQPSPLDAVPKILRKSSAMQPPEPPEEDTGYGPPMPPKSRPPSLLMSRPSSPEVTRNWVLRYDNEPPEPEVLGHQVGSNSQPIHMSRQEVEKMLEDDRQIARETAQNLD